MAGATVLALSSSKLTETAGRWLKLISGITRPDLCRCAAELQRIHAPLTGPRLP
jgi:hypothetical protein